MKYVRIAAEVLRLLPHAIIGISTAYAAAKRLLKGDHYGRSRHPRS